MSDQVAEVSTKYLVDVATNSVPAGYKQTEVGGIPEDWEATTVGQVTSWLSGGTPNRKREDYWQGDIPWISGSTLKTLELETSDQFLTSEGVEAGSKMAPLDATLLLVRGSALHSEIRAGLVVAPLCFNQDVKALIPNKSIVPRYLTLYLLAMESELLKLVSSAGNSAGVLDTELVKNFKFLQPPKHEQTAIANALSDVDALISELEKLIAKKQAIKTATMQQLLTGKIRLTSGELIMENGERKTHYQLSTVNSQFVKHSELGEIPEDWEVVPLGSLALIKTGSKNNQDKVTDGQFPFFVRSENIERLNSYSYDCEAILVPGEGGIGTIFHYIRGKFDAHQRVYVIRNFEKCVGKYIYFQMRRSFGSHAMENSVKATVDSLRLPTFLEFKVLLPSEEEQTAIATILSDMDEEIQALEQRLGKTRQIKQGMMQELLTGKTRLINGEWKMENGK